MKWFSQTKGMIINIVAEHPQLSLREIYYYIKKDKNITYQGVSKAIQELQRVGVLDKEDMLYSLSKSWLVELKDITEKLKKKYGPTRAELFVQKVGQHIHDFIKKSPCCIIGLSPGGGRLFGQPLYEFLKSKGCDVVYTEVSREADIVNPAFLKDRICILVCHATYDYEYSKTEFNKIIPVIKKHISHELVPSFRIAAEDDGGEIADFYCTRPE